MSDFVCSMVNIICDIFQGATLKPFVKYLKAKVGLKREPSFNEKIAFKVSGLEFHQCYHTEAFSD